MKSHLWPKEMYGGVSTSPSGALDPPGSDVSTVDHEHPSGALASQPHRTEGNVLHVQLNLQAKTGPSHHEQRLGHTHTLDCHLCKAV